MMTIIVLMAEISVKLCIPREVDEIEQHWHKRITYSLVGGHMLSALYDFYDDVQSADGTSDNTVSMQHVLKRGEGLIAALDTCDVDSEKLIKLFVDTGYMLHKNNRFTYPLRTIANTDNISFLRGILPWEKFSISGTGAYTIGFEDSSTTIERMFGIEEQNINNWFSNFMNNIRWQETDHMPQDVDFLNISGNAKNGYWQTRPPKQGITLCRSKGNGKKEYMILRLSNIIEKSVLPDWRIDNGEYYRIAIAIRISNENAPTVTVRLKKYTVELVTDFLLPSAEQNFFELYSWATSGDSRWRRTIAINLYPTFKRIFERLGYKISEVQ